MRDFVNYAAQYEFLQDHLFELRELAAPTMVLPALIAGDFILGTRALGGYAYQNHTIYINTIHDKDILVETISHEFKHAIQYMENPEGFKKFAASLDRKNSMVVDWDKYYMNPIEIGARIFSANYCLYTKNLMSRQTFLALL
jgi:hypothetical protein